MPIHKEVLVYTSRVNKSRLSKLRGKLGKRCDARTRGRHHLFKRKLLPGDESVPMARFQTVGTCFVCQAIIIQVWDVVPGASRPWSDSNWTWHERCDDGKTYVSHVDPFGARESV